MLEVFGHSMKDGKTLGQFIAMRRNYMKLTQEEMAEKIGVSKSAIAKWETDGGLPDRDNLKKLAEIINVSVDELHRIIKGKNESCLIKKCFILTDLDIRNITRDVFKLFIVRASWFHA